LGPVRHRSAKAQIHLTVIRARAELVSARTALVNAARGLVKSFGERLRKCGAYHDLALSIGTLSASAMGVQFLSLVDSKPLLKW
jgi:transposase